MIFHLDLDAFFASVEEKYYPQYKNMPLVVGGQTKTGIVSTCNYLARYRGVKKGTSISEAYSKCADLVVINNHRERYEYWSQRFFDYLKDKFTNHIEIASIDECYLQVDDLLKKYHDNPILLASIMQRDIMNDLGLSVSIGIADTKEIAKITTNFKKPFGISYTTNQEIKTKIYDLPIEKVNGLGKKSIPFLKEKNINFVKDFVNKENESYLIDFLGTNYKKIKNGLIGNGHKNIELENNNSKTIEKSYRFSNAEWDEEIIKNKIKQIGKSVLSDLMKQKQKACTVTVYLKYKDHLVHRKTKVVNLTNSYSILLSEWIKLFYSLWENDEPILLVGVGVTRLI